MNLYSHMECFALSLFFTFIKMLGRYYRNFSLQRYCNYLRKVRLMLGVLAQHCSSLHIACYKIVMFIFMNLRNKLTNPAGIYFIYNQNCSLSMKDIFWDPKF